MFLAVKNIILRSVYTFYLLRDSWHKRGLRTPSVKGLSMLLSRGSPSARDPVSSHATQDTLPLPLRSMFYLLLLGLRPAHQTGFLVSWFPLRFRQGRHQPERVGGKEKLWYSSTMSPHSLGLAEALFQLQLSNSPPITEASSLDSDNCPWFSFSGGPPSVVNTQWFTIWGELPIPL